ncbi:MAG: zinc ribbon domain-containing protein [Acidobacteriota bacterium]
MNAAPTVAPAAPAKLRKFPCAACGADVVWSPGAAALTCPYCGAKKDVPKTSGQVTERPIEEALKGATDLGWGLARKAVSCRGCGATTTFDAGVAASRCAFCGAPSVVEAPPSTTMVRPAGVLPFRVDRNAATGRFRQWLSSLWFRPDDLSQKSALSELKGVYVPFWTFDAATHSAWTADAGFDYQVEVQVEENGQVHTRYETRTRWEPADGVLEHFFDDLPVAASRGLPPDLARAIEPFPTAELLAYEPSYLSGFLAEEYAVGPKEALAAGQQRMTQELYALCGREVPGDRFRNLAVRTAWSGIACKNGLFPVWIAAYQYGGKPYRFLVNGVTGKTDGHAPWSWVKIGLAVAAAVLLFVILAAIAG